ncbi:B12-binding domain-containing radical SAM protein [Streptomyces poriferorum]|uniref:Radical SAM protein n=1 Tax=Streptomyces poriferorum TaxID=2798799 RepID=A0ABY9IPK7_9ACTN|nr:MULTISPECIES: radical SAM protein [unclassified Streptomyces]MDP5315560.1 radical SAM protein [Streptomyces sp. Alt4]WLQ55591.1 radical SAM protein [Streptomyces sp. Alt2]
MARTTPATRKTSGTRQGPEILRIAPALTPAEAAEFSPAMAFVNPSVGYSDRRKSKPIGLAYVMAYLRSHGLESEGFDFGGALREPELLAAEHRLDTYDIVGFSVYNESADNALRMAAWVKERNPAALVVLGGPHATAVAGHLVVAHPQVDLVVRREGEEPMLEIARRVAARRPVTGVLGTTWREPSGEAASREDPPFIEDLDSLPFPDARFTSDSGYPTLTYFDDVSGRLKPALTVNTSRSCPYNCSFCGVLTIGRRYRTRSPESVVEEIGYFRKRDGIPYQHIYFSDANFYVNPRRSLAVVEAIHAYDPGITVSFGTRVNQILRSEDILARMKEIGLRFVELGIESASPTMLERLAKGVSPQVNVDAVRTLQRLGLEIVVDFIMFDPATTLADLRLNLSFLRRLGFYDYVPHEAIYTTLVLYQGTPIREFYERRHGRVFAPNELPDIVGLYENDDVAAVAAGMRWFRRAWQPAIDTALADGELCAEKWRAGGRTGDHLSQLQLDLVALRHVPYLYMQHLVEVAGTGLPVAEEEYGAHLPTTGAPRTALPELIARVRESVGDEHLDRDPSLLTRFA